MSSSEITAGKAFLRLLVDDEGFSRGLDSARANLDAFSSSALKIGATLGGIGVAITAPIAASLGVFSEVGSALNDMSDRTGVSVESLSQLKFAAAQTGTSLEAVESALRYMAKSGQDVNSFDKVAKDIASIEDPTKRMQAAMMAWGKSGAELLPMVTNLESLREEAKRAGVTLSTEAAKSADDLGDSLDTLKAQITATSAAFGAVFAPSVTKLLELVSRALPVFNDFVQAHKDAATFIGAVGAALVVMGGGLAHLGVAGKLASSAIKGLSVALSLLQKNPWLVVGTLALTGLSVAISSLIDQWLGLSESTDAATESASQNTKAMQDSIEALAAGNKELQKRRDALAQLTEQEKYWALTAEERERKAAERKPADDLRVKGIDEQLRSNQESIDTRERSLKFRLSEQGRLQNERANGGGDAFRARVAGLLTSNQAEIDRLQDELLGLQKYAAELQSKRDEITGEAAKKRVEAEKKANEEIAEHQRQLDKAREERAKAAQKYAERFVDTKKTVMSQLDAFSRPARDTFNGRLLGQIFGTSLADSRETKQLKLSTDQLTMLTQIRDSLRRSGVIIMGTT